MLLLTLTHSPQTPPSIQSHQLEGHICRHYVQSYSPDQRTSLEVDEEDKAYGQGRGAEGLALHPGRGSPLSTSVRTLWLSDDHKTGTRLLGPDMVCSQEKVQQSPIFL